MISDFVITQYSPTEAKISWTTSSADNVNWIFVDGSPVASAYITSETDRAIVVPWKAGETHYAEVHELDVGVDCKSVAPAPNFRPDISWNNLAEAVRYRIYLDDTRIKSVAQDAQVLRFTTASPRDFAEGWNDVRIEATDKYANESVRDNWPYFVFTPLDNPSAVALTGTGPYTLTITP